VGGGRRTESRARAAVDWGRETEKKNAQHDLNVFFASEEMRFRHRQYKKWHSASRTREMARCGATLRRGYRDLLPHRSGVWEELYGRGGKRKKWKTTMCVTGIKICLEKPRLGTKRSRPFGGEAILLGDGERLHEKGDGELSHCAGKKHEEI